MVSIIDADVDTISSRHMDQAHSAAWHGAARQNLLVARRTNTRFSPTACRKLLGAVSEKCYRVEYVRTASRLSAGSRDAHSIAGGFAVRR